MMSAKESRTNRLKPCGVVASADGAGVTEGSAVSVSPGIGGGVNYWLLIAAIVFLIAIFGAPIAYRMLDEGKRGEGPGAGSPAQEAISHDQRGKISEKIVKESTPADASAEAIFPAETSSLERPGTPFPKEMEPEMGERSASQELEARDAATEVEQDPSEAAESQPTPESDGVDRDKLPDEAAVTADAAAEEPFGGKTPGTPVPEAKSPEAPDDAPSTTDESGPVDKSGASQPEAAVETVLKGDAVPPDNREVIVEMGNVRDGPSIEAEVKFRIKRGDTLTVLEQHGSWYAIELQDGRSGWAHNTLFSPKTQAAKKNEAADGTTLMKEIRAIRPVITKDGRTGVIFELNGYYPPETQVLDGGQPRLVCDFHNARISGNIPRTRELENGYIERIRIGIHDEPQPKVRVVMDFKPGADYTVEQLFYEKENYYTFIIKPRE